MPSFLDKIIWIGGGYNKYFKQRVSKNQIVLHHTVSSGDAKSIKRFWSSQKFNLGTPFIIDREGNIFQLYNSAYWSWHIGKVDRERSKLNIQKKINLSKYSIGIELINMGGLEKINGKYFNAYKQIWVGNVFDLGFEFRGYRYFEPYTEKQIQSAYELVLFLGEKYNIPIEFSNEIFDLNMKALSGEKGLFAHVSYREDKSDIYPHPLIEKIFVKKS